MSFRSPKTSPIETHHQDQGTLERLNSPEKDLIRKPSHQQFHNQNSIGSAWTSEISLLKACGTAYEIATCLRRIEDIVQEIDQSDRIKFCKSDFELALTELSNNEIFFTDKLIRSINSIKIKYFNEVCDCLSLSISLFLTILPSSSVCYGCFRRLSSLKYFF
jgi:hypothetical protein